MLELGLTGTANTTTTNELTARTMKSGSLEVLATPAVIALMEEAACACLDGKLDEGMTTVGTQMNMKHLAPTPVGMHVHAKATVIAIQDRMITFKCEATDESGKIGEATHQRCIVGAERFQQKANAKQNAWRSTN